MVQGSESRPVRCGPDGAVRGPTPGPVRPDEVAGSGASRCWLKKKEKEKEERRGRQKALLSPASSRKRPSARVLGSAGRSVAVATPQAYRGRRQSPGCVRSCDGMQPLAASCPVSRCAPCTPEPLHPHRHTPHPTPCTPAPPHPTPSGMGTPTELQGRRRATPRCPPPHNTQPT